MSQGKHDDLADALSRMSNGDPDKAAHHGEPTPPPAAPVPTKAPAGPRVRPSAPVINRPVAKPPSGSRPATPALPLPPAVAATPAAPARPAKAALPQASSVKPAPVSYAAKRVFPAKSGVFAGVGFKQTIIPVCLTMGTLFVVTCVLFFLQDSRSALRSLPAYLPLSILAFGLLLLAVGGLNMALVRKQLGSSKSAA